MKVYIGPYKNWFGPYQLAETLCFWAKEVENENGIYEKPSWVHTFGEWLAYGNVKARAKKYDPPTPLKDTREKTWLYKLLIWVNKLKPRNIKVKIHKYDTWSMDHTLSFIILPMLKQLKEQKNGIPFIDDEDVPDEIKSTAAPPLSDEDIEHGKLEGNAEAKWNWVIDQMIFSFENKLDDNWEEKFHSGSIDFYSVVCDTNENGKPITHELIKGPNHTHSIDVDGIKEYQTRISNGFRLFGKYYENLWS